MKQGGFTPLENPAPWDGDEYNLDSLFLERLVGSKAPPFLTGFTLTELLMVTSIILILSTMVLINYRTGQLIFSLQRSTHQVAQDIRRVKELAMSTKELGGSIPQGGYGVHFKSSWPTYYKLYADTNGNEKYDISDEEVKTSNLEKGVFLKSVSPDNLSINFKPPEPKVNIHPDQDLVIIILALESDPEKTKTIKINKLGLITIE